MRYLIVYDTLCEGHQTAKDEHGKPIYYPSKDEATKELFDNALAILESRTPEEIEEYNPDVSAEQIEQMRVILKRGKAEEMDKFLNENPSCNDFEEFVMTEDDFTEGYKTVFQTK